VLLESAPEVLIIPDAKEDPRFCMNPLVEGFPFIRFYAGAPLLVNGVKIGTLCIIDTKPRSSSDFGDKEAEMLQDITAMVTVLVNERHQSQTREEGSTERMLQTIEEEKCALGDNPFDCDGEWLPLSCDENLLARFRDYADSAPKRRTSYNTQSLAAMISSTIPPSATVPKWRKTACNVKTEIERLQILTRHDSSASESMQRAIESFTNALAMSKPTSASLLYSYPELFSLVISTLSPHSLKKTKLERLGLHLQTVKEYAYITEEVLNQMIDFSCDQVPDAKLGSRSSWEESFVTLSFSYSLYDNTFPASVEVLQRLVKGVNGFVSVNVKRLSKRLSTMQIRVGVPCLAPCVKSEFDFPLLLQVPSSEGTPITTKAPPNSLRVGPNHQTPPTAVAVPINSSTAEKQDSMVLFQETALVSLVRQLSKVFQTITGSKSEKIVPTSD
jgi:hypothetical protein